MEIIDKVYYLEEGIMMGEEKPGFFYCYITPDICYVDGEILEFNEFILQFMAVLSKDRITKYAFPVSEDEDAEKYFVPEKMLSTKYIREEYVKGLFFEKMETYISVYTISKENEYLKHCSRIYEDLGFSVEIYPDEDINFSVNNQQTVMDYIFSDDFIVSVFPEVVNTHCWFEINTKYMSKEEFVCLITDFTEKTGRKLEVNL